MPTIRTSFESERGCGFRKGGGLYLVCDGEGRPCGKLPFEIKPCDQCEALGLTCRLEQCRSWTTVNIDKLFASVECKSAGLGGLAHCSSCPLQGDMGKGGLLWVGEKHYPTPSTFSVEASKMGISKRLPLNQVPKDLTVGETWVLLAHPKAIDNGPCERCAVLKPLEKVEVGGLVSYQGFTKRCVVETDHGDGAYTIYESKNVDGDHWPNVPLDHLRSVVEPGKVQDADKPGKMTKCPECKGAGRDFRAGIFKVFKPSALEYIVKGDESEEELEAFEKRGFELVRVVKAEDKNGQQEIVTDDDE